MLQKQNVPLIFGQGVDTQTDEKVVPLGKLLTLENGRFKRNGALNKRFGYDALPQDILGGGKIESLRTHASFQDEIVLFDANKVYSYSEGSSAWVDRGFFNSVSFSASSIIRNTAIQKTPDVAYTNGISVYAWEDSRGGVRCTVVDQTTGLTILNDQLVEANSARPRCSATSEYLYIHYVNTSTNILKVRRIPANSPTLETAVTVAANINTTNANYDICRYGNNLILSFQTTGSVVNTSILSNAGTIGTALEGFPTPIDSLISGSGAIAVVASINGDANDGIYLFMHNTTDGLKCEIYNDALLLAHNSLIDPLTSVVNQITAIITEGSTRVWYEVNAASTGNIRIKSDGITRAGVVSSGGTGIEYMRSVGISGKAFKDADGTSFLVANHQSTLQPTYFTIRDVSTSRGMVASVFLSATSGGGTQLRSTVSNIVSITEDRHIFPALIKTKLLSESGTVFGQIGVESIVFKTDDKFQTKVLGENMHITGGLLSIYDGLSVVESGFFMYPEGLSNSVTGAAGSIEAGTRLYAAVYEWSDANGQVHQSAPSIGLSVTNVLNDRNTLTIPALRVTEKKTEASRSPVSIVLYRTKAAGTVFYRVSSITSPTLNDTTTDTVTIQDGLADTAIGSNQLLYTTGGVLENIVPRACSAVEDYRGRIVANVLDDNTLSQYSQTWTVNESVNFSDALTFRSAQDGGGITAYKTMDEKLVIFKESQIQIQVGNGPTDIGTQNDFQVPQAVVTDVGCPFPLTIVTFPGGICFRSQKGIYMLSRGLESVYIGKEVQKYNDLIPSGAVLVAQDNEIRFYHQNGVTLVYNYLSGQWGTDTGLECESSCLWKGSPSIGKSNGQVYVENRETFRDAGGAVSMKIGTSWISIAGLQGAQRIYRALFLGTLKSQHLLRIQVAYDFQDTPAEQFIFDTAAVLGSAYYGSDPYFGASAFNGANDGLYQMEVLPELQKCQSVKFQIDDVNPTNVDGEGFVMVGMLAVVGVKAGTFGMPDSKRISST